MLRTLSSLLFFFNDTATTEIYTLSLHDALPISPSPGGLASAFRGPPPHPRQRRAGRGSLSRRSRPVFRSRRAVPPWCRRRSEEHTSELQSRLHLVCRLLLEKKKTST